MGTMNIVRVLFYLEMGESRFDIYNINDFIHDFYFLIFQFQFRGNTKRTLQALPYKLRMSEDAFASISHPDCIVYC
jgi:hypothetical protein